MIDENEIHAMIDLETLSLKSTAMITQIGICIFTIDNIIDTLKINLNWEDSAKYGDIDVGTIQWWMQQSKEARTSVTNQGIDVEEGLRQMQNFIFKNKAMQFWAHATFDFPILDNYRKQFPTMVNNIPYWACRDLRTLEFLCPNIFHQLRNDIQHDAEADAIYQAEIAQLCFKSLLAKKEKELNT